MLICVVGWCVACCSCVVLCCVAVGRVVLYYVALCCVVLCYVVLCDGVSCCIALLLRCGASGVVALCWLVRWLRCLVLCCVVV